MEIRISDPLDVDRFRVCLAAFLTVDSKWSEVYSAARDLVFKFPDLMFSPEIRNNYAYPGNRIWILRDHQDLSNDDVSLALEARLRYLGLREGKYFRPNQEILQNCLRFSIQVRLSPEWSRMGCFMVRDPDFLTKNRLEVVRPELQVANNCVHLATEPSILRWYRLDLVDLQIDVEFRLKFEQNLLNTIPCQRIGASYLIVLPNMTKGRIHSVSRNMITSLAIRNYHDMRLYWRNVHGYELPEQEPKYYCNVHFGDDLSSSSGLFCYPEFCVRTLEPFPVSTPETVKQGIVSAFMNSLELKVPEVCHQQFRFPSSIPMQPVTEIVPSRQENPGLQVKIPIPERPASTYREPRVSREGDSGQDQKGNLESPRMISSATNENGIQETSKPKSLTSDSGYSTESLSLTSSSLPPQPLPPARVYATPFVATRPFIPCFKASVTAKTPARGFFPTTHIVRPVKPSFAPQVHKVMIPTVSSTSSVTTASISAMPGTSTPRATLPNFGQGNSRVQQQPLPLPSQILPPVPVTSMKPLFSMPKPLTIPKPKSTTSKKDLAKKPAPEKRKAAYDSSQETADSSIDLTVAGGAPSAPKRPKAVVRADLDIPSMASIPGGLSKVNVATLYDWCKKNGVPAKAKDKKDDLVTKVLIKLNLFVANEP